MAVNSRKDVKNWLRAQGLTVSQWARANGFALETVYAVLNGRSAGHWGQAHEVALALGLKEGVNELSIPRPLGPGPTAANSSSADNEHGRRT